MMNTIKEMELEQTRFILQIISWMDFKYLFYAFYKFRAIKHPFDKIRY